MNLLQFILIITWVIFFFFAIDSFERKRFNALHFVVFFWGTLLIMLFSLDVWLLNRFWSFFWVGRGADLLVYISIILLAYFYFEILNKITKQSLYTTRIITEQSIQKALSHDELKTIHLNKWKLDKYIFLIRSYNEWSALPGVIDDIFNKWFSKIVIVNDWSVDNTVKTVLEKKKQYPDKNIILLSHLINRWWGSANKTWFEFLKRYWDALEIEYVVTFDADWQMSIDDMDKFMKEVDDNPQIDVFLWSRFIDWWSASNITKIRRAILAWSRVVTFFFNSLWVTDPHNGYRVIKLEALKKLKIESDNMTYASELLEWIQQNHLKFKEIPVNIVYTEYSLWKWQKNSNAIKILLELIYKKFFYK
ncbi:MAG: Glycosyltransferases involved in cell wall biogenesis [uncultured bacterium (gcode 4)]|uniref:Glycosyltransferases involved in cell wall biogenesis n=1 Tax=uncultured bacterium (gcode 4) TaxID=1234023 RepID=K2FAV7_9BACT|nr:MAG: Glycosyltransferases involved in cell wall biogenesis [uncultured bacterium (gcode 4)]